VTGFREAFPILYSDDVPHAGDFYRSALGFELAYRWPPEGDPEFVFLRLEPLGIGIAARPPGEEDEFALRVYTDDVDAAAEGLRAAGAEEVAPPADQEWGERLASFRDRDGHLIHVGAKAS
jgi:lactoylglutathione lyase